MVELISFTSNIPKKILTTGAKDTVNTWAKKLKEAEKIGEAVEKLRTGKIKLVDGTIIDLSGAKKTQEMLLKTIPNEGLVKKFREAERLGE